MSKIAVTGGSGLENPDIIQSPEAFDGGYPEGKLNLPKNLLQFSTYDQLIVI